MKKTKFNQQSKPFDWWSLSSVLVSAVQAALTGFGYYFYGMIMLKNVWISLFGALLVSAITFPILVIGYIKELKLFEAKK